MQNSPEQVIGGRGVAGEGQGRPARARDLDRLARVVIGGKGGGVQRAASFAAEHVGVCGGVATGFIVLVDDDIALGSEVWSISIHYEDEKVLAVAQRIFNFQVVN